MQIRRVVTGHNDAETSIFVRDDIVESVALDLLPGWEFYDVWGGDSVPNFPSSGDKPPMASYFPKPDGFRFSFSVIPVEGTSIKEGVDIEAATREVEAVLPGLMGHLEPNGMHTTDTIDFEIVMQGNIYLQVDNGVEKLLKPGDCVVQNGTRHVWRNPGPDDVVLAVFMVGAHRKGGR